MVQSLQKLKLSARDFCFTRSSSVQAGLTTEIDVDTESQ
jgi:hypothetical protein